MIWPQFPWWPVKREPPADLASQLESLFHCIFVCEANERLNDRIDLSLGVRRS